MRGVVAELDDIGLAAHGIEVTTCFEAVCQGKLIDGGVLVVELLHGLEDLAMRGAVELLGRELHERFLDDLGILAEKHGGEHRLLRIDILRHDALDGAAGIRCVGKLWHGCARVFLSRGLSRGSHHTRLVRHGFFLIWTR